MYDFDDILSPEEVTKALTSVTFDGVDIWEEGDDLCIVFPTCPIKFVWNKTSHILRTSYYGLEGVISYSLFFDAWENNHALELFYELSEGAYECTENRKPYIVYGFIKDDPHNWFWTSIYRRLLEEYDGDYLPTFKVTIFPTQDYNR